MEIEKKFLIKYMPELKNATKYEILQAYVSTEPEIRVRKKNDKCYITRKSSGTLSRHEHEKEITKEEFEIGRKNANGLEIEKTRYVLPIDNGLYAEIDVYKGILAPLKVVEVEFPCEEEAMKFEPPSWFGEDVTEDRSYKNVNLAVKAFQMLDKTK